MKRYRIGKWFMIFLFIMFYTFTSYALEGWQQDGEGQWYYMQDERKVINQWVAWPDGSLRFVGKNGLIVRKDWVTYEGNRYYIKEDGTRCENEWFGIDSVPTSPDIEVKTNWYYADADGKIYRNGWYDINGKQYYFYSGGNCPLNEIFKLGESRHYVDWDSGLYQNTWFTITNTSSKGASYTYWYYAKPDGTLLMNGWYDVEGGIYYFDANGNSPRKSWVDIEGERYYVDDNGIKQENGWFTISGVNSKGQAYSNWYYAEPGSGLIKRWGWHEIERNWYYFDNNGLSYRNRWYVAEDKKRYYFNSAGILLTGWFKVAIKNTATGAMTENWYYADENGSVRTDGYYEITGKQYYFGTNGVMYKNQWVISKNGSKRYLSDTGELYENCWFHIEETNEDGTDNSNWFYAGDNGKICVNRWYTIDGKEYHFNKAGEMSTGWLADGDTNNIFYCGEDGARRYGWQWLEIPDGWSDDNESVSGYIGEYGDYAYFYFDPQNGKKKYCTSGTYRELTIEGKTYCFDTKGIMQMGWIPIKSTSPAIKGYRYYITDSKETSSLRQGQRLENIWMELDSPGTIDGGSDRGRYYFTACGEPACGLPGKYMIKKIQGKRYAFDGYGNVAWGLLEIGNEFYYFGESAKRCAGVTGRCTIIDGADSRKSVYRFDGEGKGITGVRDGYFYYKGKLQRADTAAEYEAFDVPGIGVRLINSSGKVVKKAKVKDGDGALWVTNTSGVIMQYGSDYIAQTSLPEPTAMAPD